MRLGPLSISLDFTPSGVALVYKLHFPQPAVTAPGPATAGAPVTLATAPPVFREQPAGPQLPYITRKADGLIELPEGSYSCEVAITYSDPPVAVVSPDQDVPVVDIHSRIHDKEVPYGNREYQLNRNLGFTAQIAEAVNLYAKDVLEARPDCWAPPDYEMPADWMPTTGKYGKPRDPLEEAEVPDGTPVNPELAAELAAGIGFTPPPAAFQILQEQQQPVAAPEAAEPDTDTEPATIEPMIADLSEAEPTWKPALPQPTVRPRVRDNPQA